LAERSHRRRRLTGRDPHEDHRTATPLELLFDLTFVVAFGTAANELAHYLSEGHFRTGIVGFALAVFAVAWAWINYSWFASAYDTDDWVMRLATMTLMLGVFLWARAARHDSARRPAAITYIWTILVAQAFWVLLAIAELSVATTFALAAVFVVVEMLGPFLAERRKGGTPWHAHHIAERYGLLVIITLGEGVIGTVASINAVVNGDAGWTLEAAVVAFAGIGLIFATWWTYLLVTLRESLSRQQR
jgi:low temperature requirement protein LtrA